MAKQKMKVVETRPQEAIVPIQLDLGCGKNKRAGFLGVDRRQFEGVDAVTDLTQAGKWLFSTQKIGELSLTALPVSGLGVYFLPDNSVSAAHCSHFLEHLTGPKRVQFFNELYRVLIPGGAATIITPHWASNRAYGDFTHQWPPVAEMMYYYLDRAWRKQNAPDNDIEWNVDGYDCDFHAQWGYGMDQSLMSRAEDYRNFALANYKEAAQDLHATVTARK